MSAIEQMALFEQRLKFEAKHAPEKKPKPEHIDFDKARTINNQCDWECDECGNFNFARTVTCYKCTKPIDANCKYLTNRLKEIKHERFARVFGADTAVRTLGVQPATSALSRSEGYNPAAEHAKAQQEAEYDKTAIASDNLGHQMLSSMGWGGGGLGAQEAGIAEPVRAQGSGTGRSRFQQ